MVSPLPRQPALLNLLFVRHGETQDNLDRVLQGWSDTKLTEKGQREAEIMARKIEVEHVDAIYHSPLTRIIQTVAPIITIHPGASTFPDADLRGQCLGDLEGGSYDLVDLNDPRSADGGPGVEPFDDFVARLLLVMSRIIGKEAPETTHMLRDRNVIIATHGVGITSILKALEGTKPCAEFVPKVATRGPEAFEVRWTDSDDISLMTVSEPSGLPIKDGKLDWSSITTTPFLIKYWGKREKAIL